MMINGALLVTGASGMIGHRVVLQAAQRGFEVVAAVRNQADARWTRDVGGAARAVVIEDLASDGVIANLMDIVRPAAVINAAGLVKQRPGGEDPRQLDPINAVMPHNLGTACEFLGARLVHLGTDCVFDGTAGAASEKQEPDPVDAYGQSKLRGEPKAVGATTLRTSMIGRQLRGETGLVEWLIANDGSTVSGFTNAVFSGLGTASLADLMLDLVSLEHPPDGLFHVAAEPIDKDTLLRSLVRSLGLDIEVLACAEPVIDRSLDGRRFEAETGIIVPDWPTMIERIARDAECYEAWRSN